MTAPDNVQILDRLTVQGSGRIGGIGDESAMALYRP